MTNPPTIPPEALAALPDDELRKLGEATRDEYQRRRDLLASVAPEAKRKRARR